MPVTAKKPQTSNASSIGREVLLAEADALRAFAESFDEAAFDGIVEVIRRDCDSLIVSGLGKSGNIAQKIAASLTSTGTPATYLHPVEALHGDLGIVTRRHGLVALSRSGNTEELTRFVAHFRRLGGPVIVITQCSNSRLAELSDHVLCLPNLEEAGPLKLAPTTSCILQLAAGDALAMALLSRRGFGQEHFASFHPEGSLGKRLLLRAQNLMHFGSDLPLVQADESFGKLLLETAAKRLGLALIVHADGTLLGTFTDGDLRRLLERVDNPKVLTAIQAWEKSRRSADAPAVRTSTIEPELLAVECFRLMRESQITSLVVARDNKPVGVLRLMDLVEAGIE